MIRSWKSADVRTCRPSGDQRADVSPADPSSILQVHSGCSNDHTCTSPRFNLQQIIHVMDRVNNKKKWITAQHEIPNSATRLENIFFWERQFLTLIEFGFVLQRTLHTGCTWSPMTTQSVISYPSNCATAQLPLFLHHGWSTCGPHRMPGNRYTINHVKCGLFKIFWRSDNRSIWSTFVPSTAHLENMSNSLLTA